MDEHQKLTLIAQRHGGKLLSATVSRRKLLWECNEGHKFYMSFFRVKRGKWCRKCGSSNGEREVRRLLREWNVPFMTEVTLPMLPRRRYDYYFEYKGQRYLVEFDGEQHFGFIKKYHKSKKRFLEHQLIDRIKTYAAWNSGCHLIRIDYTQLGNVAYHLSNAVHSGSWVYLSTPELYRYITDIEIPITELQQYIR